jgi:hypothetical protein
MVAAADGVPGARMSMAGIEPAYNAPPYIPSKSIIPGTGSSANVNGRRTATDIVAVSPGNAPTTSPTATPMRMRRRGCTWKTASSPAIHELISNPGGRFRTRRVRESGAAR